MPPLLFFTEQHGRSVLPTRTLPEAVKALLERVLADTERGLIAAESLTMTVDAEHSDGVLFLHATDRRADEQLRLALTAAAAIVNIIGALAWPAADRRHAVDTWHTKVCARCGIDSPVFIAARRQAPWWDRFQQTLSAAPQKARRPKRRRAAAGRPPAPAGQSSLGQQLTVYMDEVHWDDDEMAAATKAHARAIDARTVERHRTDKQQPSRKSLLAYAKALSAVRGPTQFALPAARQTARKSRPAIRPKKS